MAHLDTFPDTPASAGFAARDLHKLLVRLSDRALPFLLPLGLLGLWQVSAQQHWLPTQILPEPGAVISAFQDSLSSGELWANLIASLSWLLAGYGVGLVVGLVVGVAMGLSPTLKDYIYPSFKALAYVPVIGWLPLLLVLVGVSPVLKIILIAEATAPIVALNTDAGIRNVPLSFFELAQLYRMGRLQLLGRVVFPAAFPTLWSGVRFGLTKAWLALVAVELLASADGLGYMMVNARALFQLDVMFVSAAAIGVVGFTLDKALALIEARVLRWRPSGVRI